MPLQISDYNSFHSLFQQITIEPTKTTLEISEVYAEDSGTYTVVARNMGGETRSSCLLTIEGMFSASEADMVDAEPMKPRFTQPLKNKVVMEGSRTRMDCVVVANPEPEVLHSLLKVSTIWSPLTFLLYI